MGASVVERRGACECLNTRPHTTEPRDPNSDGVSVRKKSTGHGTRGGNVVCLKPHHKSQCLNDKFSLSPPSLLPSLSSLLSFSVSLFFSLGLSPFWVTPLVMPGAYSCMSITIYGTGAPYHLYYLFDLKGTVIYHFIYMYMYIMGLEHSG